MFIAMEITSGASSDRGVQLPVTAIDSSYAGRVVRVSSIDSSGTYNVFVSSSSPDGLLVNNALATTYYLVNNETVEFQLYVFGTTYQWRLISSTISASPTGSGTNLTFPIWTGASTLGNSQLTFDASNRYLFGGTGAIRIPNRTTLQRSVSPLTGEEAWNTTTGYKEIYGVSSWTQASFPTGTTGQTLRNDGSNWIANSSLTVGGTSLQGVANVAPTNDPYGMSLKSPNTVAVDYPLVMFNASNETLCYFSETGEFRWSNAAGIFPGANKNSVTGSVLGRNMIFYNFPLITDGQGNFNFVSDRVYNTSASGTLTNVSSVLGFNAPAGSSASMTWFSAEGTIDQNATATGITYGFRARNTLTNAIDYRAFNAVNNTGRGFFSEGTATNNFVGNTGIGASTTPRAKLDVTGGLIVDGGNVIVAASGFPGLTLYRYNSGTYAAPTAILNTNSFQLRIQGYDGSATYNPTLLQAFADGDWTGSTQRPFAIQLLSQRSGQSAPEIVFQTQPTSGRVSVGYGTIGFANMVFWGNKRYSPPVFMFRDSSGFSYMQIDSSKAVTFDGYGTGAITGTPVYISAWTSAGKFIEVNPAAFGIYGGSGTVPPSTTATVNNGITFLGNNTFPVFFTNVGGFNVTANGNIQFSSSGGAFTAGGTSVQLSGSTDGVILSSYGAGNREAADLSKTQSNYIVGLATDGTVLDVPINTELYNTITSTSSPQTLSSTRADNLINQGGTQATFTFRLPASPLDGQISKATFSNAVTVLTIDGNGTTVNGTLPTTVNIGTQIIFKNYTGLGWVRQL
jgi:hypothetical protein